MTAMTAVQEGYIPFHGYRTWYRAVGAAEEPGKLPLRVLHGGPGAAHDYLEALEAMAATGRCVIFYDQLGRGNSDHLGPFDAQLPAPQRRGAGRLKPPLRDRACRRRLSDAVQGG